MDTSKLQASLGYVVVRLAARNKTALALLFMVLDESVFELLKMEK